MAKLDDADPSSYRISPYTVGIKTVTIPQLTCQDVDLIVGSCTVLHNETLTLPLNGLTLLRGSNGAGKTCLLRSLLGLEKPRKGTLTILGRSPHRARHHIGYMPQKARDSAPMIPVLHHVTACLSGTQWGFSLRSPHRQTAMNLLHLTGAEPFAHTPIGVLSGGERQRVALAQALANTPRLLILDEPLAALDPIARHDIMHLLDHLSQKHHVSILMTAHENLILEGLSSPVREIRLDKGKLHV